jgi:transcriptional regulator with GAF, ATPase, and Fis domain
MTTLLKTCDALCESANTLSESADIDPANATLSEWVNGVRQAALLARVAQALRDHSGNRTKAAQALGVTPSYLGRVAEGSDELMRQYPPRAGNPHSQSDAKPSKTRARKKK